MQGSRFWKADWFFGVIVTLLMLAALPTDFVRSLERKAYDWGVQASAHLPSDRIAVIAIDESSLANLGRWPWPRDLHARMTDLLAGANAKVIANTVIFSEPQRDSGYGYVSRLIDLYLQLNVIEEAPGQGSTEGADPGLAPSVSLRHADIAPLGSLLQEAESVLNTDRRLAESFDQAGRVIVPMLFELGASHGKPDQPTPAFIARHQVAKVAGAGGVNEARGITPPIEPLGSKALAIGHLNTNADVDGGIRREALIIKYYDQYYPSFSLAIAAASLNLKAVDVQVNLGSEVRLANFRIPTNRDTEMLTYFYPSSEGRPAFSVDSFYDVVAGKIPASKYRDKIVLIGATAAGIG